MAGILFILTVLNACFLITNAGDFFTTTSGKKYFVEFSKALDWHDATYECSNRGMRLITPDTEEKKNEMFEIMQKNRLNGSAWTSGQKLENNSCIWTTTNSVMREYNCVEPSNNALNGQATGQNLESKKCIWSTTNGRSTEPKCTDEGIKLCFAVNKEYMEWRTLPCRGIKHHLICEINDIPEVFQERKTSDDLTSVQPVLDEDDSETNNLLRELKKFMETHLNALKESHVNEMAECKNQINLLKKFQERESNLLMEEVSFLRKSLEDLRNQTSIEKNYELTINNPKP